VTAEQFVRKHWLGRSEFPKDSEPRYRWYPGGPDVCMTCRGFTYIYTADEESNGVMLPRWCPDCDGLGHS
jgi:hypothetical protein